MRLANRVMWSDMAFEQQAELFKNRPKIYKKLQDKIKLIKRDLDMALSEAEALKGNMSGMYSMRLTSKDRLVFRVITQENEDILEVISCSTHYGDK